MRVLHESFFAYAPYFVTEKQNEELLEYLRAAERDLGPAGVHLAAPVIDGAPIVGRAEGRAGWPVWTPDGPKDAGPMPEPLQALAGDIAAAMDGSDLWSQTSTQRQPFTSVYVDRYPTGGTFVQHTDRDIYGPVVAGISLGQGSCRMTFKTPAENLEFTLHPRSLYVFAGQLRHAPVTHGIDQVSGERYAVTFRTAAPGVTRDGLRT